MPRSIEEKKRRAQKYGRRHRLLLAFRSRETLDAAVKQLKAELRASAVDASRKKQLLARLARFSDDTRRRAAIWAIVDALEAAEARGGR